MHFGLFLTRSANNSSILERATITGFKMAFIRRKSTTILLFPDFLLTKNNGLLKLQLTVFFNDTLFMQINYLSMGFLGVALVQLILPSVTFKKWVFEMQFQLVFLISFHFRYISRKNILVLVKQLLKFKFLIWV